MVEASRREPSRYPGSFVPHGGGRRGLDYNWAQWVFRQAIRQARGQRYMALACCSKSAQQTNLAALGFQFSSPVPGFRIPPWSGPYNLLRSRASLTQSVADLSAIGNWRAAGEARDLVALAVTGSYPADQPLPPRESIRLARKWLLPRRPTSRPWTGTTPVSLRRSTRRAAKVELQLQKQRLISYETDFARQNDQSSAASSAFRPDRI